MQTNAVQFSAEPIEKFADLLESAHRQSLESGVATALLSPCFLGVLVARLGTDDVRIIVGRNGEEIVLLLPVVRKAFGIYETFCPSQLPVTPLVARGLSLDPDFLRQCSRALASPVLMLSILNFDELAFGQKVSFDDTASELRPYADTMHVDLTGEFQSYWSSRSKKLRDNIKRYTNRLEKDGYRIGFVSNETMADVSEALARYAEIESSGWKGEQGTAINLADEQGRFYTDCLRCFAKDRATRIFELTLNGNVVSSRIVVFRGNGAVFLKTTYDESFSRYSPGRILLYRSLESLFDNDGLHRVEFYTKVTKDQAQWSSGTRPIVHIELHRSRATRLLRKLELAIRSRLSGLRRR